MGMQCHWKLFLTFKIAIKASILLGITVQEDKGLFSLPISFSDSAAQVLTVILKAKQKPISGNSHMTG